MEAISELETEMRVAELEDKLERLREEQLKRRTRSDRLDQDGGVAGTSHNRI